MFNRLSMIAARSDLAIAMLLMSIIFLMVIPLPTIIVDILIAGNMSIAVVLLMVAVYLQSPLEFSAFPSVLLISTLFRLALSVTTTRLILLNGDAGDIVQTFGEFVVGGNMVVGLIIFLIITIVQFLVITKGSERVAEVSARFSLDGMPGKQMSIDSDMRAGLIEVDVAQKRREDLQKESQLFGSMDGAMKFVKGDAIAGLIITFVNIVGGIAIGVGQQGMELGEAAETYSILTVGDGLVAQIPALLIAITSGIIVTRVTTGDSKDLGSDITKQIGTKPIAVMAGGVICLVFTLIPGFPKITFFVFAIIGIGTGVYLMRRDGVSLADTDTDAGLVVESEKKNQASDVNRSVDVEYYAPIIVEFSSAVSQHIDIKELNKYVKSVRNALLQDLGVPFPGIQLVFDDSKEEDEYHIMLHEVPVSKGFIGVNRVLIVGHETQLKMIEVDYSRAEPFLPERDIFWVSSDFTDLLDEYSIPYMNLSKVLSYHLSCVLKKYTEEFLGLQETRDLLTKAEKKYPELVKEVQRVLSLQKIAEVFQRLVAEEVSIRNFKKIIEALIDWGQKEKDPVMLVEYVRCQLKRYICYKHCNGQNILPTFVLDSDIEELVRNNIRQTSTGSYLALDPMTTQKVVDSIRAAVGDITSASSKPVLLTYMDIRRYVKVLVTGEIESLAVLSYQELTKDINVHPLGRITLEA